MPGRDLDADDRFVGQLFPHMRPGFVLALAGNPNVGKSTLFNHITGLEVHTAHYPGKSAQVNSGSTVVAGREIALIDLPGCYGLAGAAEEQWVNRKALFDLRPDVIVVVLDATNLARNLALALQLLDTGIPTLLCLNLGDEATRAGLDIDTGLLAELTGARVVRTVAVHGIGVGEMLEAAIEVAHREARTPAHRYSEVLESTVRPLVAAVDRSGVRAYGLPPRPLALQLIEGHDDVTARLKLAGAAGLIRVAREARTSLATRVGEPPATVLSRERHGAAGVIAERVLERAPGRRRRPEELLLSWSTRARTGVPLLLGMLLGMFGFLFFVGAALAEAFSSLWQAFASPPIRAAVHAMAGEGALARTLLWGFDAGIEASLGIGLPYILTFYFLLALLEDSGYLNAVAFLSDRSMHHLGLHGRAVIPLVAGAGCSVPAILSVRVLPTERERFISATLVSFVPCSARTAVILGAVGAYAGFAPALGVFAVTFGVIVVIGLIMNRLVPGSSSGFVMEMFPFRRPKVSVVARKAFGQFREFLVVATPLVVIGSIALGGLYETGWLPRVSGPLEPVVVGWLGLPAFAGLTLLFGLLRKEFALQLLVTLAIATTGMAGTDLSSFMTDSQVFVYALVNTLALPCISTLAVLGRVLGWKRAFGVMGVTIGVAVFIGGLFAQGFALL